MKRVPLIPPRYAPSPAASSAMASYAPFKIYRLSSERDAAGAFAVARDADGADFHIITFVLFFRRYLSFRRQRYLPPAARMLPDAASKSKTYT